MTSRISKIFKNLPQDSDDFQISRTSRISSIFWIWLQWLGVGGVRTSLVLPPSATRYGPVRG